MKKLGIFFCSVLFLAAVLSCQEKPDLGKKTQSEPNWDSSAIQQRVARLESIIAEIASSIPKNEQQLIIKHGLPYLMAEFKWEDLELKTNAIALNQAFAGIGVYSWDERRQILRENLLLHLKGEELAVGEMAMRSRSRWKKQDGVVPPVVVECPICGEIMKLTSMGNGYDKKNPEAWIFTGECAQKHHYLYDQINGWRRIGAGSPIRTKE